MTKFIYPDGLVYHKPIQGVYMVLFDNGYFYIGASKHILVRMKSHETSIRKNSYRSSAALALMKGFSGTVIFLILEIVDVPYRRWGLTKEIKDAETKHIVTHKNNKNCLNTRRYAYKRRPSCLYVD